MPSHQTALPLPEWQCHQWALVGCLTHLLEYLKRCSSLIKMVLLWGIKKIETKKWKDNLCPFVSAVHVLQRRHEYYKTKFSVLSVEHEQQNTSATQTAYRRKTLSLHDQQKISVYSRSKPCFLFWFNISLLCVFQDFLKVIWETQFSFLSLKKTTKTCKM